ERLGPSLKRQLLLTLVMSETPCSSKKVVRVLQGAMIELAHRAETLWCLCVEHCLGKAGQTVAGIDNDGERLTVNLVLLKRDLGIVVAVKARPDNHDAPSDR
ncbi:MAG: hypothetical protein RLO21_12610, partial [Nitratireductor sp.]